MNELIIGAKLQNGRYKITGKLGEGGFGITYSGSTKVKLTGNLGTSEGNMQVAIKEFFIPNKCEREPDGSVSVPLAEDRAQVEKFLKKFRREAESLSEIYHKNIVRVSEVFDENGTVYYVMSHLGGGSLSQKVKLSTQGHLNEAEALKYARQVASALSYLHGRLICHLDVKPANILLNDEGEAVLIDFGISKTFDNSYETTHSVAYTNNYAPIEQHNAITDFSPQTDIYSLSATLYFMLTGKLPPDSSEMMNEGLPPRPDYVTPNTWNAIIEGMRPRRSDRPKDIEHWLEILDGRRSDNHSPDASPSTFDDSGATITGDSDSSQFREKDSDFTPVGKPATDNNYEGETQSFQNPPHEPAVSPKPLPSGLLYAAVFIAALFIGAILFWLLAPNKLKPANEVKYTTSQVSKWLGRTDITLDSVEHYMAHVDMTGAQQSAIDTLIRRAYAMRQLLGPCFRNVPHKLPDLKGVYVANTGYMSYDQRSIFLWFFNRPTNVLYKWEQLNEPVSTLDDFKQKMEKQFNQ